MVRAGAFGLLFLQISALQAEEQDTVVVTATRTPQSLEETLAAVTVLTHEDIERVQARSVDELLRGLPGVSVDNAGGFGKATSIFLRGTESDHVVVLVDGIRIGSPTLGIAAWEHLPLDSIERIEIVRGPRSALYGPNAIGGVVQFITRAPQEGFHFAARAGSGSHDTRRLSASIDARRERLWMSATFADFDTAGFNACEGFPFPPGGGCFTSEPDADGYHNELVSARAGMRVTDSTALEIRLLDADGETEFDGSFANRARVHERAVSVHMQQRVSEASQVSAVLGRSSDDTENFLDETFASQFDTQTESLSLQWDRKFGASSTFTAGLDQLRDRVDSTTDYALDSRTDRGAFVQFNGGTGRHRLTAGLRHDDGEQFGGRETINLSYGRALAPHLRFVASGGTAYKSPTLNELYFPGFGNPNLGVEFARSVELGIASSHANHSWSLRTFGTDIDDLIAFNAATGRAENIEKARILGLELDGQWRGEHWQAGASLTAMDPENQSPGSLNGNDLPRRARLFARFELEHEIHRCAIGTVVVAEGRRFDDLANTQQLDGYVTVGLTFAWRVLPALILRGRIGNLFDTHYETAAHFNQDGRNGWLNLEYTPF